MPIFEQPISTSYWPLAPASRVLEGAYSKVFRVHHESRLAPAGGKGDTMHRNVHCLGVTVRVDLSAWTCRHEASFPRSWTGLVCVTDVSDDDKTKWGR